MRLDVRYLKNMAQIRARRAAAEKEALALIHDMRHEPDDQKRVAARVLLQERAADLIEALVGLPKYVPNPDILHKA